MLSIKLYSNSIFRKRFVNILGYFVSLVKTMWSLAHVLATSVCLVGAAETLKLLFCVDRLVLYQKNYFTLYFTCSVRFTTNFQSQSPGVLNKEVCKFAKIETPTQVFFCDFCNFFKSNFFIINFRWLLQNFNLKELISSKLFKGINPGISFFVMRLAVGLVEEL